MVQLWGIMDIGTVLIKLGSLMVITGVSIPYAPWLINWFGKLPGDFNIKNENSTVFILITSMTVIGFECGSELIF